MNLIECQNLSKKFSYNNNEFYAVKEATISFPSKGFHFIKGKSGSGKSTLLNMICGLEKPTSGKIYFNGKDISKFSSKKKEKYLNKEIGIVFQHYNLLDNESVLFNISLPLLIGKEIKKDAIEKSKKLLKRFNLENFGERKVKNLSGGEKQRVSILRALVTKPKVLFCDEPTGALDEQNSRIVMEILKEISKEILVIVISHNEDLIKGYSERTITIHDGVIVGNDNFISNNFVFNEEKKKKSIFGNWESKLSTSHFIENLGKNVVLSLVLFIGLTGVLLSFGFSVSSKESIKEYQEKSLEYGYAKIQKREIKDVEGSPLSLIKVSRPKLKDIEFLREAIPSCSIELNYSYFFSEYPDLYINNEYVEPAKFTPVLNLRDSKYKSFIVDGELPSVNSFEYVLVNKEFCDKYLFNLNPIGQILNFNHSLKINYKVDSSERDYIYDNFNYNIYSKIIGVVEEFGFLNTPKVFYSYQALRDMMNETKLSEISTFLGKEVTCFDLVNNAAVNEDYSGYSYDVFVRNDNEIPILNKLAEDLENSNSELSIDSTAFTISTTYNQLVDSFSISSIFFVIIGLVGIVFIIGISGYSSFVKDKKQTAILRTLGANNESILKIYTYESSIVSIISSSMVIIFSNFFIDIFNDFLFSQFSISNMVKLPMKSFFGIPLFIPILVIFISLLISYIATYLPIKLSSKFSLVNELRDE